MADNSELEYIDTWLTEVTTSLVVETVKTKKDVSYVSGAKKALIYTGETLWVDNSFYKKRYLIKISMESEENFMAIFNEMVDGCKLYNTTRAGLTSVGVMCNIEIPYTGKGRIEVNNRFNQDIWLDVEWASQ